MIDMADISLVFQRHERVLKDPLIALRVILDPNLTESHGDTIVQLDLPDGSADMISLEQI